MKTPEPTLAYLVPLFRGIRDEESKNWAWIDIFMKLMIPAGNDPYYLSLCVGGRINNARAGDGLTVIALRDPDNVTIAEARLGGKIEAGDVQFVGTLSRAKFEQEGRYHLKAYHHKQLLDDNGQFYIDVERLK